MNLIRIDVLARLPLVLAVCALAASQPTVADAGFVLSALPAEAARACVAIALGGGMGVAVLSAQAAIDGLRAPP
ncbi:MAG: hypothetical protein QOE17_973 [Gaiellales bacterium]|jgi:hypothetical protein|nr:hypothetical protein [Gaiellales bacterium]